MATGRLDLDQRIEAGKWQVFREVEALAPPGAIVEVGTMRNPEPSIDGRSTLFWAQETDRPVYSIEVNRANIHAARGAMADREMNRRVSFMRGGGDMEWAFPPVALLYLDNGPHPRDTLLHFLHQECHLVPGAIVLVDDCQPWASRDVPKEWGEPMPEGKGTLLLPYIRNNTCGLYSEVTMHKPPEPSPMWLASFRVG